MEERNRMQRRTERKMSTRKQQRIERCYYCLTAQSLLTFQLLSCSSSAKLAGRPIVIIRAVSQQLQHSSPLRPHTPPSRAHEMSLAREKS